MIQETRDHGPFRTQNRRITKDSDGREEQLVKDKQVSLSEDEHEHREQDKAPEESLQEEPQAS